MSTKQDKFQILSDAEHILRRQNMYVGSTTLEKQAGFIKGLWTDFQVVPGLLKIIDEIIDNSVDEFIRTKGKFANEIAVSIHNVGLDGPSVTVRDNGRGIPIELIGGEYRPVLSWSRARQGTNFNDDDNRVTMGMNGVGSFCTNVFSIEFTGKTADGKKLLIMRASDNATQTKVEVASRNGPTFTEVHFRPDMEHFEVDEITPDLLAVIEERLVNIAYTNPGLRFTFNGKKIEASSLKQMAKLYSDHPVVSESDNLDIILFPAGKDEEFRFLSYVNGLNLKNGGSHVEYIINAIVAELRPLIKKKHKIEVMPNQIRQHLSMVCYVRNMKNMRFSSQSKDKLSNTVSEMSGHFGLDAAYLAKKIMGIPEILDPMIAAILYKKELAERLELARAQKGAKKARVANHIAAQGKNPADKILFITEGQCIDREEKVFTIGGTKAIKDVEPGDFVLTHKHRFRQVVSKSFSLKEGIRINGKNYSPEHRLFVYDKSSGQFCFICVKELRAGIHQLVKHRLLSVEGAMRNMRRVKAVEDNTIRFANTRLKMTFSPTHVILTLEGADIVEKTIESIRTGDVVLL